MSESAYMSVLRVWAAVAWADGVIVPAEAEALRRLVAVAPIQAAEREIALSWLKERVDLDTAYVAGLGAEARKGVYQAAVRLAKVDLHMAKEERALLDRLSVALGLDATVAREVEAAVGGTAARA